MTNLTRRLLQLCGFHAIHKDFEIDGKVVEVKENKKQGFWAFNSIAGLQTGQTIRILQLPNPLSTTSPIPPGSCVVTGNFNTPEVIQGDESED